MTDAAPKKRRSNRKGTAGEISKETHPQLSQRLPRETGALIVPAGDGLTVLERAMLALGDRVKETRAGFILDGKICNTRDVLKAAGMKFADET